MSSTTHVPVEEYLRLTGKPYLEYLDGVLTPKSMPTKLHSLIQYLLVSLLRKQGVEAFQELTVRLSETRFLIPDVVAADRIEDPYPTKPVLLCCEILSPDDRLSAVLAKCENYHAWGVPFCWVIDPAKPAAWEYHAGSEPSPVEPNGTLRAGQLAVAWKDLLQTTNPS
jgi:Uma2 family endonuclease